MRLGSMYALLTALGLFACGRADVSGGYIAEFSNGVYWLQLVETNDGNLTGQMESLLIDGNHKLDYENASLSGAADGSNVSITLKPLSFLPVTVAISGIMSGDRLTLSGGFGSGTPQMVAFTRSNIKHYQALAAALKERSTALVAADEKAATKAKAQADAARRKQEFVATLDQLSRDIDSFNPVANQYLQNVRNIAESLSNNTSKMRDLLDRERTLVGNQNSSYGRGQIVYMINQGSFASNELHSKLQSIESDFQSNGRKLMNLVTQATDGCRSLSETPDDQINEDCQQLISKQPSFQATFDELEKELARVGSIYQYEHTIQAELANEASRIE